MWKWYLKKKVNVAKQLNSIKMSDLTSEDNKF